MLKASTTELLLNEVFKWVMLGVGENMHFYLFYLSFFLVQGYSIQLGCPVEMSLEQSGVQPGSNEMIQQICTCALHCTNRRRIRGNIHLVEDRRIINQKK